MDLSLCPLRDNCGWMRCHHRYLHQTGSCLDQGDGRLRSVRSSKCGVARCQRVKGMTGKDLLAAKAQYRKDSRLRDPDVRRAYQEVEEGA